MKKILFLLVATSTVGACKWSEFDNIKDDVIVQATDKPDNGSTIWGVGLVPARRDQSMGEAGVLGVFGVSEPGYTEVVYAAAGGAKIGDRSVKFQDFGYASINVDPIVLASPDSDDIALIGVPSNEAIAVRGQSAELDPVSLPGSMTPDAATYVRTGATSQDAPLLVVADDDNLYGVDATTTARRCTLVTSTFPEIVGLPRVRAMGAMRVPGAADQLVLWLDEGHILLLPNTLFDVGSTSCPGGTTNEAEITVAGMTAFVPKAGSKILDIRAFGAGNVGSQDLVFFGRGEATAGMLGNGSLQSFHVMDATHLVAVGGAQALEHPTSAAVLHTASDIFVAIGAPTATVSNVPAGQVTLFPVDVAMGVGSPLLTLSDAQPQEGQQYGRAVTAIPYNDAEVLAVAGDNEVYLYYRTELYDETRVRGQ